VRIAVVVRRFPAPSQTFVSDQVLGLAALGHRVEVFPERPRRMADDDASWRNAGVVVHYPRESGRKVARTFIGEAVRSPRAAFRLGRTAREMLVSPRVRDRRFDVVQCHFGEGGLRGLQMRRANVVRGPLATVFHGADLCRSVQRQGTRMYDELFASGDLFQPVTERFADVLRSMGCPPDRIVVHRMGVDLSRFAYQPRVWRSDERIEIVSIGRMVEKKGFAYGIRAMARLASRDPRLRYTIIGDGELRPELERLVADLELAGVVRLAGWLPPADVAAALRGAHLMLAPSVTAADGDQEGLPVVIMEAMATGLPVVATRHSGIPELVRHGESGALVPEHDADALAEAIETLVRAPDRWGAMGAAGRRRVEVQHDLQTLNRQLAETYARVRPRAES
jgi:colanic acid/amylovoran biosynthesis glycosyltransferase